MIVLVENFEIIIIESFPDGIDRKDLLVIEENYIEEYDSVNNGYNMTLGGEGFDSETNSKYGKLRWQSEEYRKLMDEKRIPAMQTEEYKQNHARITAEMWNNQDYRNSVAIGVKQYWSVEENRIKNGEAVRKALDTPEQKQRLSDNAKKNWLKPGYRENQLKKQSEKWDDPTSGSYALKGDYQITDPDGNTYVIKGMKAFCRLHNLSSKEMFAVTKGRKKSYKGWIAIKL